MFKFFKTSKQTLRFRYSYDTMHAVMYLRNKLNITFIQAHNFCGSYIAKRKKLLIKKLDFLSEKF